MDDDYVLTQTSTGYASPAMHYLLQKIGSDWSLRRFGQCAQR